MPAIDMINLSHLTLKGVLMLIGLWFSNPFIPDFGIQFLVSFTIGMLLPQKIVEPLNKIVLKVPYVDKFEKFLKSHRRFRTIIPRIFAGYFITYCIGWSLLLISYFLL